MYESDFSHLSTKQNEMTAFPQIQQRTANKPFLLLSVAAILAATMNGRLGFAAVVTGEIEAVSPSAVTVRGQEFLLDGETENRGTISITNAAQGQRITVSTNGVSVLWYRVISDDSRDPTSLDELQDQLTKKKELINEGREQRKQHTPGFNPDDGRRLIRDVPQLNLNNKRVEDFIGRYVREMVAGDGQQLMEAIPVYELFSICLFKDIKWVSTGNLHLAARTLGGMPPTLGLAKTNGGGLYTVSSLKNKVIQELDRRSKPPAPFDVAVGADEQVVEVVFDDLEGDMLVESDSARVLIEEGSGVTYWAPRSRNKTATVIYKIDLPGPFLKVRKWGLGVYAYNHFSSNEFDPGSQCELAVSPDGKIWTVVQSNFGVLQPEDSRGPTLEQLEGSKTLFLRARLRISTTHPKVAYSQFLRGVPGKNEYPRIEVICKGHSANLTGD